MMCYRRKDLIALYTLTGEYYVKVLKKLQITCLFTTVLGPESGGRYCIILIYTGWFLKHVMGCSQVKQTSLKERRKRLFSTNFFLPHYGQYGVKEIIEYLRDVPIQKMNCGRICFWVAIWLKNVKSFILSPDAKQKTSNNRIKL